MSEFSPQVHEIERKQQPFLESVIFVALTYLISWASWFISSRMTGLGFRLSVFSATIAVSWTQIFLIFGYLGPGIAAIIVLSASGTRIVRIARLWTSLTTLSGSWAWYAFALLIVPSIDAFAVIFYVKNGGRILSLSPLSYWPYLFLVNLPLASLPAEVGWRGFLLPRAISWSNVFIASIIVGSVNAFWYSPFFGVLSIRARRQEWTSFLYYASATVAISLMYTVIYLRTKRSLIPVIVLHSSTLASEVTLSRILQPGRMHPFVLASQVVWLVGLLAYNLYRRTPDVSDLD